MSCVFHEKGHTSSPWHISPNVQLLIRKTSFISNRICHFRASLTTPCLWRMWVWRETGSRFCCVNLQNWSKQNYSWRWWQGQFQYKLGGKPWSNIPFWVWSSCLHLIPPFNEDSVKQRWQPRTFKEPNPTSPSTWHCFVLGSPTNTKWPSCTPLSLLQKHHRSALL